MTVPLFNRLLSIPTSQLFTHSRGIQINTALFTENIEIMSMVQQFRGQGDLLDAVIATTSFNCSDLRDHLYALLSIPSIGSSVQPDYSLSVEEVYTNYAVSLLVNEKTLKILGLAPGVTQQSTPFTRQPTPLDLPSWVPNLAGECRGTLCAYSVFPWIYDAGGAHIPPIRVSDEKRRLHCQGRIIDTARALASMDIYHVPFDSVRFEHLLAQFSGSETLMRKHIFACLWLLQSREFIFPGQEHLTAEQWLTFGRVMTCLQVAMREPLPPKTLEAFEAYFTHIIGVIDRRRATDPAVELLVTQHGLLIETSLLSVAQERRLCRTENERPAQVPVTTQEGDVFAVLLGGEAPFLLRPVGGEGQRRYTLLGQAYLDGMMHGESLGDDRFKTEEIIIQ